MIPQYCALIARLYEQRARRDRGYAGEFAWAEHETARGATAEQILAQVPARERRAQRLADPDEQAGAQQALDDLARRLHEALRWPEIWIRRCADLGIEEAHDELQAAA